MEAWIDTVTSRLGHVGIGLLMMLEHVFPPIPSEVVLPAAGFSARRGELALRGVLLAGFVGSVAGASVWYVVGRSIGTERIREWVERRGRWIGLSGRDVDQADRWFDERGWWAVLLGRMIPGLRTLVSLPAGASEMPVGMFLLYTSIGTFVWNGFLVSAGWWLGHNADVLATYIGPISTAVVVGLCLWAVVWIVRRRRGSSVRVEG